MKEWEKAQLEVEEEERKHNEEVQTSRQTHFKLKKTKLCVLVLHVLFFIFDFLFSLCFFQERRILEETVTPLNPTGLLNQVSGQTATTSPGTENDNTKGKNFPLQHNGQKISTGNEDQHASKLHFFQGEHEVLTFLDRQSEGKNKHLKKLDQRSFSLQRTTFIMRTVKHSLEFIILCYSFL